MAHLNNHEILATQNLHEMQEILAAVSGTMDLDVVGKNQEINASLRSVQCNGLVLMHITYGEVSTSVRTHEDDEGDYLFFVMTDGAANVKHNGKDFDISKTTGLMRDSRLPLLAQQDAFSSFAVPLSSDALNAHMTTLLGDEYAGLDITFDPQVDLTTPNGRHLHNTVHYVANALNDPLGGVIHPFMLNSMKDVLMTSILTILPHSSSDLLQGQASTKIVPYYLKRARDYIHAHAASSITLEMLSSHAGCGYRTLQKAFKEAYGVSPMGYVSLTRLNYAHEDLRRADGSMTVRDVALKWGYPDMSWFAKSYLKQFGTLPSKTLRNGL